MEEKRVLGDEENSDDSGDKHESGDKRDAVDKGNVSNKVCMYLTNCKHLNCYLLIDGERVGGMF